ncbi:hypothetical protein PENTCL1PPCAC_29861, partial [Pristionchus entomophagus]
MLYLVHWPVIVIFTYYAENIKINSLESVKMAVVITILLTLIAHYTIKQWSLRTGYVSSGIFVGIIYSMLSIILYNSTSISGLVLSNRLNSLTHFEIETTPGHKTNFTKDQFLGIISFNLVFPGHDYPSKRFQDDDQNRKWMKEASQLISKSFIWKGNGRLSVLILENSFAQRAAPVIRVVFQDYFSVMRLYAGVGE